MTVSYRELLKSYSSYVRPSGYDATVATALRTRSRALRDVIAYASTHGKFSVDDLRALLNEGKLSSVDFEPLWFAGLGRVIALQSAQDSSSVNREDDVKLGLACLSLANPAIPKDQTHQQFHRLEIELLAAGGEIREAIDLVERNDFLRDYYYGYLRADLDNPFISGRTDSYSDWLEGFNRPFVYNNLMTVRMPDHSAPSFDNLETDKVLPHRGGPKVSVIMTSYKPDGDTFLLAVRSILRQSWQNLELIIVDDASPRMFEKVLTQAKNLDPRVKLVKLPVNGGTYRARNAGIAASSGDFITGQDSDDWSHPERLAYQVGHMLANPLSSGVVVEAIRMDNDLVRMFPGRIPHRRCEVSLMTSADIARRLGGYLEARKGADSEFRRRIETFTGKAIQGIDKPLYLIRTGHESLSRGDFKPGWSHPARRAFWNASQHWHENTMPSNLRIATESYMPIPVPNRFKISVPPDGSHFDAVFIGDWRAYGGIQRTMLDGIMTLARMGQRIAVMHLESLLSPSKETTRLGVEIQSLINQGVVEEVIPDESATASITLIHDPTILQFAPHEDVCLRSEVTLIATDIAPPTSSRQDLWYRPEDCDRVARSMFNGTVVWTSMDPAIRRRLATSQRLGNVLTEEMPLTFQPKYWRNSRSRLDSGNFVIGRHAANNHADWPEELESVEVLWPSNGESEVRILGDARPYLRKYKKSHYPLDWVVFRDNEIRPEAFMSGLDFFVYFPDEGRVQSYCRQAIEAAVSGAVVILPESFRDIHGDSAIYADVHEVPNIIRDYADSSQHRLRMQEKSNKADQTYDNGAYAEYIKCVISTYKTPTRDSSETCA